MIDPINLFGILVGISVLVFIILAMSRGELSDMERPKYEMLGLEPPEEAPPTKRGRIGIEDRIIRLGLVGAAFYYASRIGGAGDPAGLLLMIFGSYMLLTGIVGRDPFYYWRKIDTRFRDT